MCQKTGKRDLHLEPVGMHCGLWSVTPDKGDLFDIDFFCKCIGIKRSELKELLEKEQILFSIRVEVLCFETKELAEKAIDVIVGTTNTKVRP